MPYCAKCGAAAEVTASFCTACGSALSPTAGPGALIAPRRYGNESALQAQRQRTNGSYWLSIMSLIAGILGLLGVFSEIAYAQAKLDELWGIAHPGIGQSNFLELKLPMSQEVVVLLFVILGGALLCGAASLKRGDPGKGMACAGIVLSVLGQTVLWGTL